VSPLQTRSACCIRVTPRALRDTIGRVHAALPRREQVGAAALPLATDAKGEKPAELPVQQVSKVETDINLTGCQSASPPSLLLRADAQQRTPRHRLFRQRFPRTVSPAVSMRSAHTLSTARYDDSGTWPSNIVG